MKNILHKPLFLMLIMGLGSSVAVDAQPPSVKRKVQESMEEKYAEPQREKGREAIRGVSYENDTRFTDVENRVEATIDMEIKSFKKNGKEKDKTNTKIIFGPSGECMATGYGTNDETRIVFNYADAANYVVNVKDKTAMKMPLINVGKMVNRMSQAMPDAEEPHGSWKKTSEQQTINGFSSEKYVYTDNDGTSMEVWATQDITIDLRDNYLFGTQIKDYGIEMEGKQNIDPNIPRGMAVRTLSYDKNGDLTNQMDITKFDKSYDPAYFDLKKYKVIDIIDKL
jgi:hypothetical protein